MPGAHRELSILDLQWGWDITKSLQHGRLFCVFPVTVQCKRYLASVLILRNKNCRSKRPESGQCVVSGRESKNCRNLQKTEFDES